MKTSIVSVFLWMALAMSNAIASPTFLYRFHTTNIECFSRSNEGGICLGGNEGYAEYLNQMSVVFNLVAIRDKSAYMYYDTLTNGGIYTFENDGGISELNVGISSPDISIPLDRHYYESLANEGYPSYISASFSIGRHLQGGITLYDGSAEMFMSSNGVTVDPWFFGESGAPNRLYSLPLSENEWGGVIRGDDLADSVIGYTGIWRFSRAVPEPASIFLMALALAAVMLLTSRRRALQIRGRSAYPELL